MFSKTREKIEFCDIVFLVAIVFVGGFNEYISCLLSCVLIGYLFARYILKKSIYYKQNFLTISVAIICVSYGLTCFWAIDSGMAFIGFLKFLPVLLYIVANCQSEGKSKVLEYIPYFATIIVIVSIIGSRIPALKEFFLVAGRFAGVFQYPNTFALFLLICELLLLKKFRFNVINCICMLILSGGLLYTGSRTVFVLFLLSNFVLLLVLVKRRARIVFIISAIVGVFALIGSLYIFKDNPIINRYLNIDFGASTFIGRLLYFRDALPLLLKYPFGMGYMGYYYIQHTIQSGVYNVVYVHNDFLQFFLDVGIIPATLFIVAVARYFFKKNVELSQKIIVATFCLHTLFDFNLQYVAMFFFLLLLLDTGEGEKTKKIKKSIFIKLAMIVMIVVNLYMATALIFAHYNAYDVATAMYPYNTRCNLLVLERETDLQEANELADRIIKQNDTYFAPYSVKSKYAYSIGDFAEVINNKNSVFIRYPFRYTEYKEYCVMLINGVVAFSRQGDTQSVKACNDEIIAASEKLQLNKERLSKLGSMIDEQPVFNFSEDVLEYINKIKEE